MQFQVPQFIEREARVVGPLTFRQVLYIGAAGAVASVMYFTVSFFIFLIGTILVLGIGISLAFFSVGGKSFPSLIIGFLSFNIGTKTYMWKKGEFSPAIAKTVHEAPAKEPAMGQVSLTRESKIKNLSTKLDGR